MFDILSNISKLSMVFYDFFLRADEKMHQEFNHHFADLKPN
jgi:hypothetical protein